MKLLICLFILFFCCCFTGLAFLPRLLINRWLALFNNSLVLARYKQLIFQAFRHEDLRTRAHAKSLSKILFGLFLSLELQWESRNIPYSKPLALT
uniref:Putative secreted protein n=1 Tax=Ixodes ricinus TaxID=34613 RepID=A0A0K8RNW7_IXORI